MGDLCRCPCEEGFVRNVEHLAGKCLLDDGYAEVMGEREDGAARDAVEHGVGEGRGVERTAADEEEVLA